MHKLYSNKWTITSLILPGVIMFLVAVLAPIVIGFFYSLTDYNGIASTNFIGLENYLKLFQDPIFWTTMKNSAILVCTSLLIEHPLAMLIAYKLDKLPYKWETILRWVYFVPNIISIVITAALWKYVYNPNFGLIQKVLEFFGIHAKFNLLGSGTAIFALAFVLLQGGIGWAILFFYTGIKNIDPVLNEAALIDGATSQQTFRYITFPLLKPVRKYCIVLAFISSLKQMELVFLMTQGGPNNETHFLGSYLYDCAFNYNRYGYGNAIGMVLIGICLLSTVAINFVFKERRAKRR